jgi:hypothetical protein
MPHPHSSGSDRRRGGPVRDSDGDGLEGARACASCDQPAVQTVLIAVFGVMLVKDLCGRHLILLLDGARESVKPAPGARSPGPAAPDGSL